MSTSVQWANGIHSQVNIQTPAQLRVSFTNLALRTDQSRVLIALSAPITQSQRAQFKAQGLTLLNSLGSTNYFATLSKDADINALSQSTVVDVSAVNKTHKLHTDLLTGVIQPWTISKQGAVTKTDLKARVGIEPILVEEFERVGVDPIIAVVVMFHKDADFRTEGKRLANQLGARLTSEIYSVNSVVLHMPASRIDDLANDDAVMWAEPPLPGFTTNNAENRILTETNAVQSPTYGLDGSGVSVLVYDGGRVLTTHPDFSGRATIGQSDTDSTSNHATHVAGTVGGDGTNSSGNNRGMAPGVSIISYGFEQAGGIQEGFLYTDPGDLEADYTEAINLYGADLSNNSIGTNTAPNGFDCTWTGNYGITSALIDSIVAGSIGNPFRIVWANGNERSSFRCQGDDNGNHGEYYSTAPPSCAKNHITVGSVDSDTDGTSYFSSWGPTDDGRIKPDISAPGCQLGGDGGVTSLSSSGGYTTMCGTSMASPTVAGISALILEQYRITFPNRTDLRNATLKAILANTAVDRGNVGPDYQYGYGSVRATNAVDAVLAESVIEAEVAQSGTYRFIVILDPADTELKVTLAWDDVPAVPNVSPSLVNDLDIKVIDANGTVHLPWTLNPSNPSAPAVRNVRDGINNIEQVLIDNAAPGAYTVEVTGFNIAQGPTQSFGVASNGYLVNCSSAGIVSLGAQTVPCSGTVGIQVIDCDLNTSDLIVDTVQVLVSSDSDTGFMLTLTETAPESSAFLASFSFSDSIGQDLLVSPGDSINATYIDADDGQGGTNVPVLSTMTVDCTPPSINNVNAINILPRSATVSVQMSEPATTTVRYGLNMFALNDSVNSGAFLANQSVNIAGLTDQTTYFYTVEAQDPAGNTTLDDNAGAGYTFTTPDIPDFFTEEFDNGLDLQGQTLTLTPSASVDRYTATIEPLAGGILPFNPADGTPTSLTDDDSNQISVTGGKAVQIYGQSFTSFYVGSNGYITFSTSDTDYTEDFDDHFDTLRVSGLFDDLNPANGGQVYTQQLADRVVISYDMVPEFSNTGANTFQIELHFNGTIVISWERIDTGDAIAGISEGLGVDPDFIMSDLSTFPAPSCAADLNGDGIINFADVSAFIALYSANNIAADFNGDGIINFTDVSAFVAAFTAGCP